jgi:dTDP-4-amino-4,6-dideoxygalactose transaminase
VVTSDPEVAEQVRMLRSYGERSHYESVIRAGNSRLDALQASVLLAKLARLEAWTIRRRELAARYRQALAGSGLELPEDPAGGRHAYHLFVLRVPDREAFRRDLNERGVGTLVHYPRAVHQHPAYADVARSPTGLETAERLAAEVVSLPLFPELTDAEADEVAASVLSLRRAA